MLENCSGITPIAVIVSFNPDGKIRPIYFSHENIKYRITDVMSVQKEVNKFIFTCTYIDISTEMTKGNIKLLYRLRDQIWGLVL